ncbi:hypothetical protein [Endozoicomonas sp. ONNA2]|uniref:hypothetical protein n=1 Tax=Endozoicomonas sp. ONNA2 TaxID=2828741 RepID=UPI0021484964|nr:hypothetical protein [Endozoicomonas sp. ONNA2]
MKIRSNIEQALFAKGQPKNRTNIKGDFNKHKVTGSAENTHMPASSEITKSGGDSRMPLSMQKIAVADQKPAGPPAAPPPPPVKIQSDTWAQIKQNISTNQDKAKKNNKKISDHMNELFKKLKKRREVTIKTEDVRITEPRVQEPQPAEPVAPMKIETVVVAPGMIPPPPPLPAVLSGKKVINNAGKPAIKPKPVLTKSKLTPPQFQMTTDMFKSVKLKKTGKCLVES